MSEAEHIKELMDAREAAIQARLDQHVAVRLIPLEINLEHLRELMNQRFAAVHERFVAVHERFTGLDRRIDDLTAEVRELGRRLDSFKVTMMVAVVATGLSTVLGMAAFNAALLSNMQESYKSGQGAGAQQADTSRLLADIRKDITDMRKDQSEFRAQTESQFKEMQQEFKEVRQEIGRLQRPANTAPPARKPTAGTPLPRPRP